MNQPGIKRGLNFLMELGSCGWGEGILRCQAGLQEAVRKGTLENVFNLEAATVYTHARPTAPERPPRLCPHPGLQHWEECEGCLSAIESLTSGGLGLPSTVFLCNAVTLGFSKVCSVTSVQAI